MLNFLKSLFESESIWYDYQLYQFLKKWTQFNGWPFDYLYPHKIQLSSLFWKNIMLLKSYTDQDEHERGASVFWIDGDWVFLQSIRGDKHSVSTQYKIMVKYEPSTKEYFNKVVYANGKIVFKKAVFYKKIPKKIEIFKMFSLHTHPPHSYLDVQGNIKTYYSFFSLTDVNSLIKDVGVVSILVADSVYMLCKTDKTPTFPLDKFTITKSSLLNKHFVLYQASFNDKVFYKVNKSNG